MAPLRPRCAPPLRHPAQPNVAMAAAMLGAEGRGAQGDGGVRVGARAKRPRRFLRMTTAPRHRCALRPSPATAPPSRSLSTCSANRSGGARCRSRRGCSTTGGAPPFAPSSPPMVSTGAADRPPPRAAVSSTPSSRRWLGAELPRRGPRSCPRPPAAHCVDSLYPPAARPLPLSANEPTTTGPCPDLPLNPLTGQSSGYGLPSWCWRCLPQPGAGGSSPLRRRTCPPMSPSALLTRHFDVSFGRA